MENVLQQAEERDRINQNQVSEFRQEGQEYAQMFRNAEHGVFGFQGEGLAACCREAAHRTEASIALQKLEKTQDVVQTLLSEMSNVREEQVATSHHCEFLTTELKAERSAAVAAGMTSGNRGDSQENGDLNALGTEFSRKI